MIGVGFPILLLQALLVSRL